MRKSALVSHMKGKKYADKIKETQSAKINIFYESSRGWFFCKEYIRCICPGETNWYSNMFKHTANNNQFCVHKWYIECRTLMGTRCICSNYSFNYQSDEVQIFQKMFPTCTLAKTMSLGETKMTYMTCFWLALYFSSLLEKLTKDPLYVLMFDETLNKDLKKKHSIYHYL